MVFHQNVRGLLDKSEVLISFLSPDFPQLLRLTEHHLKRTEIDFIYIWININLVLNFAGNLSRMVELVFLYMISFSVQILSG